MKPITRDFLEKRKAIIVQDLLLKVEAEDWHGVADAAMDLREIAVQMPLIQPEAEIATPRIPQWLVDQMTKQQAQ